MKEYKLGAIIFSRLDSNRLFGKALIDIEGRCLLERVIDRTKLIEDISEIIVATSDREIDDPIANFAKKKGVEIYRGSCDDVFQRSIQACKKFKLNGFARICGDRPYFDYELVSKGIQIFKNSELDLVTTLYPKTFPPGLTTEIINIRLLEKYDKSIQDAYDREHLTTFFYENNLEIKIKNIDNKNYQKMKNISLVVDNHHDLKRAKWIASHEKNTFSELPINQIISLASEFDDLKISNE